MFHLSLPRRWRRRPGKRDDPVHCPASAILSWLHVRRLSLHMVEHISDADRATFPSTVIPFFIAHSPTSGNEDCTTARWCASRPIQRLSGHFIIPKVWSRVDWRTLNASLSDQITRLEMEKTEISEDRDAVFCGDENRSVKTAWGEDVFASINIIHHRLAFFFFPSPRCSAGVSAFSSCCIQSRNSSVQIFFLFPFGHAGETHREDMKTLNSLHQLKHGVLTKRNT